MSEQLFGGVVVVFSVVVVVVVGLVVEEPVVGGWVLQGPRYSGTFPSSHQSMHGIGPESSGKSFAISMGQLGMS